MLGSFETAPCGRLQPKTVPYHLMLIRIRIQGNSTDPDPGKIVRIWIQGNSTDPDPGK